MNCDTHRSLKWLAIVICCAPLFAPQVVAAQQTYFIENNKTIAQLGAQDDYFYVGFVEPSGQDCHGLWYIPAVRKNLYVQLLAAKLTGRQLSRIDYEQPGGNGTQCFHRLVELAS